MEQSVMRLSSNILATICLGLVLAGCSMADSTYLPEISHKSGFGCDTNLGHYYLAKSYLEVRVDRRYRRKVKSEGADKQAVEVGEQEAAEPAVTSTPTGSNLVADHRIRVTGLYTRADKSKAYCFDYRPGITSKDTVHLWKNDRGLLTKISSRAEDQSVQIIKDIIHTVFTLVAGGPLDSEGRAPRGLENDARYNWHEVFKHQFDPTESAAINELNDRLNDFGFCVASQTQQVVADTPGEYCEDPLRFDGHEVVTSKARLIPTAYGETTKPARTESSGIFYRPRIPLNLYLFHRVNRKVPGLWRIRRSTKLDIENHAPLVSVGIDRTFFAERETVLVFNNGLLEDVQIYKTSQLENFIEIPIYLAKHIAHLPTNLIQVQINQFNNDTQIRKAERSLLEAQTALYQKNQGLPGGKTSSELKGLDGSTNLLKASN